MNAVIRLLTITGRLIRPSPRRSLILHGKICALFLGFALLVGQAHAAFHLWQVNELYSNADGSVQFIELRDASPFGGQQFVAGHTITVSGPAGIHTFTCATNLPTDSLGKTFIIGTSNLSSFPGGLTPNFVFTNTVPFLFVGGGATNTVNWTGSDIVTYTNLPGDGSGSLVRSVGSMVLAPTNSPKNFNDESNSIVPVMIQSIQPSGNDFILTFATATGTNGTVGPNYALEFSDLLGDTNWVTLANVVGDGSVKSVTNANPPDPQRFYRLRVP